MIIHDGHLGRSIVGPPKNDAPLVIDPNGVQARQIASERFQTVAGRNGKVAEDAGLIHLDQLSQRDPGYGRETAAAPFAEQIGGIPVREGLDQAERASHGIERIAISPARTITMEMTKANFGRPMKNPENMAGYAAGVEGAAVISERVQSCSPAGR